jgi:hypothetical protein
VSAKEGEKEKRRGVKKKMSENMSEREREIVANIKTKYVYSPVGMNIGVKKFYLTLAFKEDNNCIQTPLCGFM